MIGSANLTDAVQQGNIEIDVEVTGRSSAPWNRNFDALIAQVVTAAAPARKLTRSPRDLRLRKNLQAERMVCARFVVLCRELGLFTRVVVAIDGSKFKAVNNRDKNYTVAKVTGRMEQVDASIARYLRALDRADREESDVAEAKSVRLKEKIAGLRRQMQALKCISSNLI